jgi:hypothetical protein
VDRKRQLFEIILALSASGSFASLLHCRQQQGYQDGNDGNHHQKFDQGETAVRSGQGSHTCLRKWKKRGKKTQAQCAALSENFGKMEVSDLVKLVEFRVFFGSGILDMFAENPQNLKWLCAAAVAPCSRSRACH